MAATRSFTYLAFALLFLCLSLPLIHADEADTDSTESSVPTLRVGMVRDLYLRYADQDTTIYGGLLYWANWVNAQGGFPWGNTTLRVDPIQTLDASTPDPKQLNKSITAAVKSLIVDYGIDIFVSPASYERSYYCIQVTEQYGIPNFVVDVTSDTLFARYRFKNIFTLTYNPSHIVPFALDAILPKIQNYTILSSSDVGSTTVTNAAKSYFAARNITFLGQQIVANNASDTSKLESDIRAALTSMNTSDLLVSVFYEPNFPQLINGFTASQSTVKAAVYMMPGFLNIARTYSVQKLANYWIGASQFDAPISNTYGVPGEFGGTYTDFATQFKSWNNIAPEPLATISFPCILVPPSSLPL